MEKVVGSLITAADLQSIDHQNKSRTETAIAANAGLYTLLDDNLEFLYGMEHTGMNLETQLPDAYQKRLVLFLGEFDKDICLGKFITTDLTIQ